MNEKGNYVTLDMRNPEKVLLQKSFTGVIVDNNKEVSIMNYPAYDTKSELYGRYDLETGAVSFPAESLLVVLEDVIWFGNSEEHILLYLTPDAGVETIDTADSCLPVEYFDLMGRKVNELQGKGIYIRRHGNASIKIIK